MKSRQLLTCPDCDEELVRSVDKYPVRPEGHRVMDRMRCPNCYDVVIERHYYRGPLDW
jgi:predicted RNA-binding Zn-ribbon protein involved in translation (DUF1610 family)